MEHFQLLSDRIQSLAGQANSIDGLLGNFIVGMLADFLESRHRTEQVPGLGTVLGSIVMGCHRVGHTLRKTALRSIL